MTTPPDTPQSDRPEPPDHAEPMEEPPMDCPPAIIEVRRNADGSLDEIVADGCFFHLEQMSDGHWWMGITKDGYRQVVNITAVAGGLCGAWSEMDDWPGGGAEPPVATD